MVHYSDSMAYKFHASSLAVIPLKAPVYLCSTDEHVHAAMVTLSCLGALGINSNANEYMQRGMHPRLQYNYANET